MDQADAIALLKPGVPATTLPVAWTDLGCGSGTFTKALASLLPTGSTITAIDQVAQKISSPIASVNITFVQSDFQQIQSIPTQLDGILMANALHYCQDQLQFLTSLKQCLKSSGKLILVEYDTDLANPWVPYPVGFKNLKELLFRAGYKDITKIGERDSIYHQNKMYACAAICS